jgi:O-antigen/teichoic acid export membrane protein
MMETNGVSINSRSKQYFVQVKASLVYKVLAIAASFFLTPLMIHYLEEERFGVWVTIFSFFSWTVFFDLGLGNGLRNNVAESLSLKKRFEASEFISSGYIFISIITGFVFLAFLFAVFAVDWRVVFNTNGIPARELRLSVLISGFFFFATFALSLVKHLLNAIQRTSWVVVLQMLTNVLALILVGILYIFFDTNLIYLAVIYGISLLLPPLAANILFFKINNDLLPSFKKFSRTKIKTVMGLGFQFFIIQLAVLMLFSVDRIIVTQLFGPSQVSQYQVVFKLFSLIFIANSIFLVPLWSAYSDAIARNDIIWMSKSLKNSNFLFVLLAAISFILMLTGPYIVRIWIGAGFSVGKDLFVAFFVYAVVRVWCDIYSHFLNGISRIKVQMWIAVVQVVINVPLSIYLGGLFGLQGVVYATVFSLLLSAVGLPLHAMYCFKVGFKKNASVAC